MIQNKSFRLTKAPSANKTWLQAWFLEFYKLRNDVMLGQPIIPKEYVWDITQHLRIASEILPMTIIIILNRDPNILLPLKNDDEKRIKIVDDYIQYSRKKWFGRNDFHQYGPSWLKGHLHPNLWDSIP